MNAQVSLLNLRLYEPFNYDGKVVEMIEKDPITMLSVCYPKGWQNEMGRVKSYTLSLYTTVTPVHTLATRKMLLTKELNAAIKELEDLIEWRDKGNRYHLGEWIVPQIIKARNDVRRLTAWQKKLNAQG